MKKWLRPCLGFLLTVPLLVGGIPAAANAASDNGDEIPVKARETTSLRSLSIPKSLSHLPYSSNLAIIQFRGPILKEWQEEVEQLGVQLGYYLPDYAYIAKLNDKESKNRLRQLSYIQSVEPFHPAYKLSPDLKHVSGEEKIEVAVIGFDRQKSVTQTIQRVAPRATALSAANHSHISQVSINASDLTRLLVSDDVIAIEPLNERKPLNDVAREIIFSEPLAETGYTGAGQIVGVADTGLDTGNLESIHPDFQGQVKKLVGVDGSGEAHDWHGHGTHVAGSVLGTGAASDGKYRGLAPDAQLVFRAMGAEMSGDFHEILTEAYQAGARIHSDSWGSDDYGEYSYDSATADEFVWEHKDLLILVAAGNSGEEGEHTVGSPATAKNVLAVGASESIRLDDPISDNPDEIASFSSRGPTADGRIKPDIVSPGTFILSTRSRLASDFNYWMPFDEYYAYMGGTSMATPILAGGAAQVRQFLNEQGVNRPSAALMKAMLVAGADDLGLSPYDQGFGRANLAAAIETDFVDETNGMETGDSETYTIDVTETDKPFRLTLAWTDYPSLPYAYKTLVNDLNLVVETPSGKVYRGNDFDRNPDDETDNLNNVENVFIEHPETGTYTVTVTAFNIPKGAQPYAIATTGDIREDTDLILSGLVLSDNMVEVHVGETVTVDVTARYADQSEEVVTSQATWTSSAPFVATVENGRITGVKAGTATITARYEGKSASATVTVHNVDDYEIWPAKTDVAPDKQWTIRFNKRLDAGTVNGQNVYVTDSQGNVVEVEVTLGGDNQSVLVSPPIGGAYERGQTYTLHIDRNVASSVGKKLPKPIRMTFTIRD